MFRCSNLQKLSQILKTFPTNIFNQSVRWRRKPRWLPVAKSKQFRVPPRTVTPKNEQVELMRLFNNYRTQMKAIRSYLHNEYNVKSVTDDTEGKEKLFNEEFAACCDINKVWNTQRKIEREARNARELEEDKKIAHKRIEEREIIQKQLLESAEEVVRREKDACKNLITLENLEAAIEYAIANPVDFNYSIDLNGNYYHGRNTKPEATKIEMKTT